MSGAISLAGQACVKSGAGRVTIATALESLPIVASFDPCYMTVGLPANSMGLPTSNSREQLKELGPAISAYGIGPGLGVSEDLVELVTWLYTRISAPMVVDADALNCLANNSGALLKPGGPRILTPHPGEMRRLLNDSVSTDEDLDFRTEALAREAGVVIVLKTHQSLITTGTKRVFNTTGNSGMATGGSGDVLTGVITSLLAQGMETFDAAHLGCLIHGLAGDAGAKRIGKISLCAKDIMRFVPKAIRQVRRRERRIIRKLREQRKAREQS